MNPNVFRIALKKLPSKDDCRFPHLLHRDSSEGIRASQYLQWIIFKVLFTLGLLVVICQGQWPTWLACSTSSTRYVTCIQGLGLAWSLCNHPLRFWALFYQHFLPVSSCLLSQGQRRDRDRLRLQRPLMTGNIGTVHQLYQYPQRHLPVCIAAWNQQQVKKLVSSCAFFLCSWKTSIKHVKDRGNLTKMKPVSGFCFSNDQRDSPWPNLFS